MNYANTHKGFTVFFAMLIASLSLAIGIAIYDLTIRELDLSQTATDSQYAIYAADTGAECALFWDFNYTDDDFSAYGTSSESAWPPSGSGINCVGTDLSSDSGWNVASQKTADSAITRFTISIAAPTRTYCAEVEVEKYTNSNDVLFTTVTSRGYNTCDSGSVLRTERALQITY